MIVHCKLATMLLMGFLIVGCGSKTSDKWTENRVKVHQVEGLVTLEGTPLEGATITLNPTTGADAATGISDANGKFKLTTFEANDGAPEGSFDVTVSKLSIVEIPAGYNPDTSPPLPQPKQLIPVKYSSPKGSGLKAEISGTHKNTLHLELSSK